jgi:UDP-N-acetylmuramate: L-alanyl-gamma-D-glutamyl-meso-diaminopimelate ligase
MNDKPQKIHFIGIGGSAMAPIAIALKQHGYGITGSDTNVYPPVSTLLSENGISFFQGYAAQNLVSNPDLVVVGNAISRGNSELEEMLNRRVPYCSLPELVKNFFLQGKRPIVVTGTHGKTTVSSLLAWVLECGGKNPSFLIGGIPLNFGVGARFTDSEWLVIEGDEYDTAFFDKRSKFLHYLPQLVVVNNLEFDHADIFANLEAIQLSFTNLMKLIPERGRVFINGDDPNILNPLKQARCPVVKYGLGAGNDLTATVSSLTPAMTTFLLNGVQFEINLAGEFNVRNAMAVIACARECGVNDDQIQEAFYSFKSAKRRMEVFGQVSGVTIVDDFAHHPTAIKETIKGMRSRYPGRRLWVAFEPRTNTTRRSVFQKELAEALAGADLVTLGAVARSNQLAATERLDVTVLMEQISSAGKAAYQFDTASEIATHYSQRKLPNDVFCIMTNGAFDGLGAKLVDALQKTPD